MATWQELSPLLAEMFGGAGSEFLVTSLDHSRFLASIVSATAMAMPTRLMIVAGLSGGTSG